MQSFVRYMVMVTVSILLGGLIVPFLILETICRLLPVSDRVEFMPVDDHHPYLHAKPDQVYHLTQGNLFQIQTIKRTNNEGFFCDLDLKSRDTLPGVVVIGDSFVEALQVANSESVHAHLDSLLPSEWSVYGIGSSGSALPQYLAYARYAMERFKPKAIVFIIYQNDFSESFLGKSAIAGHHYFMRDGQMIRLDRPRESWWKQTVFKSAFFRYLWLNVKLPRFFNKPVNRSKSASLEVDEQTVTVTRLFLMQLKKIVGDMPVWFLTDAPRPAIYTRNWEQAAATHPVAMQYAHFRTEARLIGFHTVDMTEVFRDDYFRHRQRFEFPTDGHWNTRGHRLAAQALADSMLPSLLPQVR